MVVEGLQERSRLNIMDGLRSFVVVDKHEAVRVGDSEKIMKSRKVKPKKKKVCCAPSLTALMWETADGSQRSCMRTGAPSARSFSKGSQSSPGILVDSFPEDEEEDSSELSFFRWISYVPGDAGCLIV